jgi:formiminotetrahydrofolate cyclodeaminase
MGKPVPPGPGTVADLREATREAHEVLKDLRAVLREIRQLQAGHTAKMDDAAASATRTAVDAITAMANLALSHVQANIDLVKDHEAQLLGAADLPALMDVLVTSVTESLIAQQDRWVIPGTSAQRV